MRRASLYGESCIRWPVSGGINRCVIFPANVIMTAEAVERRKLCWFVRTNVASDLIVHVGGDSFHLHQLPLIPRSGYLNRLVFQRRNNGETKYSLNIQVDNLPGGTQILELVVKFCYGLPVDLTATNVAPLYCAAHFLEMSEDLEQGNLISKTEAFLSFVIFSSWKDTIQIFKSCEDVSSCAEELGIVKRCSESIAWKACTEPRTISCGDDDALCLNVLTNNTKNSDNNGKKDGDNSNIVAESWWFKDVSVLRIDHFVEVINAIKTKGMRSGLVGACIAYWTSKWVPTIKLGIDYDDNEVQRVTIESLIKALPIEKSSVSCNFLLYLLKVGLLMNIDRELTIELERRVAMMLESCCVRDLVVKNYENDDTVYDASLVIKVVEAYVAYFSSNPTSRMALVARLVDEYATVVARDDNLSVKTFQLLAEALPENARYCDDKLYSAIDMYLKSHPALTEEERRRVCRAMDYHKLSLEAQNHAMKNDRLPLNITTQFILFEQVNMIRSILADGSNYRRTKSQEIVRRDRGKRWVKTNKELLIMKEEVEKMKMQLNDLQVCKLQLQRQVK